ncbi:MAG: TonB-dependent receptor [Cyclobacteriaceae bacterium]|nr:TonB-dependent receptor [Cyclobacteriaceae bacterium]
MKQCYLSLKFLFIFLFISAASFAQTQISGTIKDDKGEPLAGVNIVIKGRVIGTITDLNGKFNFSVNDVPPMKMVVSFIGFRTQEIDITEASTTLDLSMEEETLLGQEVVVSASRVEESIMESPVSIEKMDILAVQTTPSDNYYKGIANLKGVDVTTSSINFQIINTRGFGSTGNTRFVQLTDGMDTQAPALNFPIGNLNGPSELDVESVELIPGASSALYGPNAFNGILLVNSKNAFEYQGLSAFAKTGFNHIGSDADFNGPSPVWEGAIRYAKAFNNKFAFKLNAAYMQAEDWHGTDATDREIARTPSGFSFNPGSDGLHLMGDEASIPLSIFRLSANTPAGPGWEALASSGIGLFAPGVTAWNYAQNDWLPGHVVSVTPYKEADLIDYGAKNIKFNAGLYYRLNDRVELSYLYNGGFGTSIYTGAQRYSLKNFGIEQHRLQIRADNFYVRAYTTRENSGDSYITEFLSKRLQDIRSGGNVSNWLGTYGIYYLRYLYDNGYPDPSVGGNNVSIPLNVQEAAHNFARTQTDNRFPLPVGTAEFENAKKQALNGVVPDGPKFKDASNLYHIEGQYDFKNQITSIELQAGGSFRMYDLNSNGTIFDDANENITIKEYGAYVQAGKWLGDRKVKLSGSARYDKNENFKGRLNPRISLVWKAGRDHNIRLSYQTGFRLPTTQGQHIDLNIISARLLGGLPRYAEKYNLVRSSSTGQPLAYEGFSVQNYRTAVFNAGASQAQIFNPANTALLTPYTEFNKVKPEVIQSIETGYKGIIGGDLLVDLTYYYNIYNDFITQIRIVTATELPDGSPNYASMLNGTAHIVNSNGSIGGNTSQIYSNSDEQVTSQGAVIGLTYNLPKGYTVGGNYNWNVLNTVNTNFLSEFNTPEHKMNFNFGNRKLTEKIGFNVNMRWQSEFEWQSSFTLPANGKVPSYTTVDAQVSVKLTGLKAQLKIGGSNLFNQKYIQSLGGPNIGALYYTSITFDDLLRK